MGRIEILWRGGWHYHAPGGIPGTVCTWAFTDSMPAFRWWIVGPVEIWWTISGEPRDDEIYEPFGTKEAT